MNMLVGWYMIPEENFGSSSWSCICSSVEGVKYVLCFWVFLSLQLVKLSNYINTCKKKIKKKHIKKHINTFIKHRKKNIIHEVGKWMEKGYSGVGPCLQSHDVHDVQLSPPHIAVASFRHDPSAAGPCWTALCWCILISHEFTHSSVEFNQLLTCA